MRESIGSIALYNIIIVFIVVTFAILSGTMSYSKAFKVNNRIINAIEKYEGYNDLSAEWIDKFLATIGYNYDPKGKCGKRNGYEPVLDRNKDYWFCVYAYPEETRAHNGQYMSYGVITYIYIDIPLIGDYLRVPVYGKSNRIFCFGKMCPVSDESV